MKRLEVVAKMTQWNSFVVRRLNHRQPTPYRFLRFFVRWSWLEWVDRHLETCWAGMVMWKMGYEWSWWPNRNCQDREGSNYDYCGKYKSAEEVPVKK